MTQNTALTEQELAEEMSLLASGWTPATEFHEEVRKRIWNDLPNDGAPYADDDGRVVFTKAFFLKLAHIRTLTQSQEWCGDMDKASPSTTVQVCKFDHYIGEWVFGHVETWNLKSGGWQYWRPIVPPGNTEEKA